MKSKTATIFIFIIIVIGLVVGMSLIASGKKTKASTALVSCMVEKGVKFYGAFWCPHCQEQEAWLGMSRDELSGAGLYIECSTPDGQGQTAVCQEKKIEGYPTWVMPDGTRQLKEFHPEELSAMTSCPLVEPASS